MRSARLRGYLDACGVLVCEIVLLAFFLGSGRLLGTVPFAHLAGWVESVSPDHALTALMRLLGTVVSGWLLVSTAIYWIATLSGSRGLLKGSRLITLPALRRAFDTLAAASMAAASVSTATSMAAASPPVRLAPLVQPLPASHPGAKAAAPTAARPSAPARVSGTATGRHFPHPGKVAHVAPLSPALGDRQAAAPSEQNGFAGLPKGTKVVVVRPGDCLSVLAEEHLGDWRLDSEIEALNFGRPQPDGRALIDDHWIYPGWVLVMPKDAIGTQVVGQGTDNPPVPAPHAARRRRPGRDRSRLWCHTGQASRKEVTFPYRRCHHG